MEKSARLKTAALERIMAGHHAWEKRTLSDLRSAGYNFTTVDQADRHLRAQRTVRAMNEEQLVESFASLTQNQRS